jgi:hypothetical protein
VPPTHSLSLAQETRQLPVVHVNGEQSWAFGIEQVPVPVHMPAGWKVDGGVHVKLVHIVPAATWAQAPSTQKPVLPQTPLGVQRPCGSNSAWVVPTDEQVPCPLRLHAWQTPQEGALQQTPSTQLLLVHSWAVPHAAPFAFFVRQEPFGPEQ